MRSLTEIIASLKDDLARMPKHKRGSQWESDRIRELVRLEAKLAEAQTAD